MQQQFFFRLTFNIQSYGPLNDCKYRIFVVTLCPKLFLSKHCMELNKKLKICIIILRWLYRILIIRPVDLCTASHPKTKCSGGPSSLDLLCFLEPPLILARYIFLPFYTKNHLAGDINSTNLLVMIKVTVTLTFDLLTSKSIGVLYESPPTFMSRLRTKDPSIL